MHTRLFLEKYWLGEVILKSTSGVSTFQTILYTVHLQESACYESHYPILQTPLINVLQFGKYKVLFTRKLIPTDTNYVFSSTSTFAKK